MRFLKPNQYQPKCQAIFDELKPKLMSALPYARIEHIGSSAVPNAVSKGDLDIFVGVPHTRFNDSITLLEHSGFKIKEDTLRTNSLCMFVTDKYDFDVAIQLVESGSENDNFLLFRDLLKSDPKLVEDYNEIKIRSEDLSSEEYRTEKSKFILMVLRRQ